MKLAVIVLVAVIGVASAQFAPLRFAPLKPVIATRAPIRFAPVTTIESGQYRGASNNDGRYIPDDSGKYVHFDAGYGGGYGQYAGDNGRYIHQDSKYVHSGGPSGGSGPGFIGGSGSGSGSGAGFRGTGSGTYTPTVKYGAGEGGWKIIRQDQAIDPPYHYLYETENKILAEETGHLENVNQKEPSIRALGFYEYIGDDGVKYRVDYTADENGFVPKGAHIAEAVVKNVEFLSKNVQ